MYDLNYLELNMEKYGENNYLLNFYFFLKGNYGSHMAE